MFDIIIPVYNVEKYIERCVRSVVANCSPEDNVIVVNDGSTDSSMELVLKTAPKSWIIHNQNNLGLSEARNAGLRLASSKYVIFVDSDDFLEPGSLSDIRMLIKKNDFPDVVVTNTRIVESSDRDRLIVPSRRALIDKRLHQLPPAAWDKVVRRSLFDETDIWFPVGRAFEDLPTTYPLVLAAKHIEKYDGVLINWVQRPDSISRSAVFKDYYFDVFKNFDLLSQRCKAIMGERFDLGMEVYLKKVFLDTVIRWNNLGRDKGVLEKIVQLDAGRATVSNILASRLRVREKVSILVFRLYCAVTLGN